MENNNIEPKDKTTLELQKILNDEEMVEYKKLNNYVVFSSYKKLRNNARLFLILKNKNSFTNEEIKAILRDEQILKIDDKFYTNFSKVNIDEINQETSLKFYKKNVFKNIRRAKKYEKEKNEIVKEEFDLYEKYVVEPVSIPLKQNFEVYEVIKDKNYIDEKAKRLILLNDFSTPCFTLNPKYWAKKNTKVKKVINSTKIKDEDKTKEIQDRINYKFANPNDVLRDVKSRIYTGIGVLLVCSVLLWPIGYYVFINEAESIQKIDYGKIW